jgi:hypothetical protein
MGTSGAKCNFHDDLVNLLTFQRTHQAVRRIWDQRVAPSEAVLAMLRIVDQQP